MSDRFYMQMVTATGWAPGYRNTKTIEEYKSRFGSTKEEKKYVLDRREKTRSNRHVCR